MTVKRIQRVVIVVRNLEEAARRYAELLGTAFMDLPPQDALGVRAMASEDWLVELISPTGPQGLAARYLAKHGEGVMGIAFEVPDIGEAGARIKSKGFRVLNELDFADGVNWKTFREIIVDPRETNGAPVMLVQIEPM